MSISPETIYPIRFYTIYYNIIDINNIIMYIIKNIMYMHLHHFRHSTPSLPPCIQRALSREPYASLSLPC